MAAVMALALSSCVSAWPQFGYGPGRTGFNPNEKTLTPANVSTLTSKWEQDVPSSSGVRDQSRTVAVAEGLVFLATGDAVYALDETTGSIRWSYPVTESSEVAYDNGKIFFSSLDRHVLAVVASSGALVWRAPTLPIPESTTQAVQGELTVFGGKVYFIGSDTRMYALDEQTGQQVTSFDLAEPGPMAIDPTTGNIYVVQENDSGPCCIDPRVIDAYSPSGALLWVEAVALQSMPVIAAGRVYVGNQAFDAATGKQVWLNTATSAPTVAAADGMVFGVGGGLLIARDAATGQDLWSTPVSVFGVLAVANGVVYMQGGGGIEAFDEHTGALLSTVASPQPLESFIPVVADGRIFAAGNVIDASGNPTGQLAVDVFGQP